MRTQISALLAVGLCAPLWSTNLYAQQPPDAGTLLREQPTPPVLPSTPQKIEPAAPVEQAAEVAGPKILVKGFRIKGAVLISETELQDQLKGAVGKELTLGQLQNLALYLVGYYVQQGHIARVIVPPQDIKDGIVEIQVIEGKRGSLNIDNQGSQVDSARVQGFIDQRLAKGAPMSLITLGEAMNILNEQPGVEAKVAMAPGKGEGEIDLDLRTTATRLVTASVGVNNQGTRATGRYQAQGSISLNNPTSRFDVASFLVNASEGTTFVRADYGVAVGNSGLRLGANASYLDYQITLDSLSALDSHGTASTAGLAASYPLARRNDFNLSLTGSYDYKKLIDKTSTGETGNRRVNVISLGLDGYGQFNNTLLAGGVTSFGLNLNVGDSQQNNAAALATDSTSRQIEGGFAKLGFNLGHIRPITQDWNFTTSLRGQLASQNLDSTERLSLGGPGGVRAYPVGEANGDEGWILNLNARHSLSDKLAATVFLDAGGIRLNHDTWAGWNAANPRLENSYQLYGAGAGLDWRFAPNALLSATLAAPIGSNPGRDTNNHNTEGKKDQARLWLSLNARF